MLDVEIYLTFPQKLFSSENLNLVHMMLAVFSYISIRMLVLIPLFIDFLFVSYKTVIAGPGSLVGCASAWYSDGRRFFLRSGKTFLHRYWS